MQGKLKVALWTILWFYVTLLMFKGHSRFRIVNKDEQSDNDIKPKDFRPDGWKKIVIWTNYFRWRVAWNTIFRRLIAGECEERRCSVSLEREDIASADAVIFHAYNLLSERKAPANLLPHIFPMPDRAKYSNQIFVFYSMEPPPRLLEGSIIGNLNNYFNWTMTYRLDSDVVEVFGRVRKRKTKRPKNEVKYVTQAEMEEKKMSLWVASHCPTPILPRDKFLNNLKSYIKVDVYGKCGKPCDHYNGVNLLGTSIGKNSCDVLAGNYHFYLSLENSLCKDYVTEKIFKAWSMGIIPVVFGSANYSSFAPPKSYIDVRDFPTLAALTQHLKMVASDAKLYNEYLKWKEDYDIEEGSPYKPFVCDLCKKLHTHSSPKYKKSYPDISDWFVNQSNCQDDLGIN